MKVILPLSGLVAFGASLAAASTVPAITTVSGNPFDGAHFYESPVYREKIELAIKNLTARGEKDLAKKAAKVAKVSTFLWISDEASLPNISRYLLDALKVQLLTQKTQVIQFVLYNLPDRDCSAKASSGEYDLANGGEEKYKAWIDKAVKEFKKVPFVRVVVQLETDAIGNLVTNLANPKCGNAAPAHKRLMSYAIAKLQLPNVSLYIDGAHAGWLGWPDNLAPTASVMAEIIAGAKAINPKAKVRGVTTNVSNYNGLGNQPQQGRDELKYINDLAPLLAAKGFDAHFLVDQGRSGNQQAPREGGDWCNFKAAGFGPRPSTVTPSPLIDAIVWVKPGGEADGTSDTTSPRFDVACGSPSALQPAPEAGSWFEEYFELLIKQADPAF